MSITLDFETRSIVDLKRLGAMRYATDASTQVLCMSWAYDQDEHIHFWHRDHPWQKASARPDELLARIKDGELVEAHNAKFEYLIWNYVLMREYPEFDVPLLVEQTRCSAAKASCLSLPRGLGDALKAIGAPAEFLKDTDGGRLINKLCKPQRKRKTETAVTWCEEQVEHHRNWEYNKQDVRAERYLSEFCGDCMSARELQYWHMDFRMNLRGIKLDARAADEAIKLAGKETERLDYEMQRITDGEVFGGSKRIPFRAWANKQIEAINFCGFGPPMEPLPNTKADTLSFALYGVPTKAGDEAKENRTAEMAELWDQRGSIGETLKRAMEICIEVNRSSVAKFRRMKGSVCPDGRLHDIMLYNGADRTGRWSGQTVQPHNFVRGYQKEMPLVWETLFTHDPALVTLVTGDSMLPALAKACRGALTASDGQELYAADFNAIEARKLAWMANCTKQLGLFAANGDPYIDMASAIYNREVTKADKNERQLGKKAVLGLGYAMGWEKFQYTVFMEEGIWLDDEFCKRVVNIYRQTKCPEMPILWKDIEMAAINAVSRGGEHWAGGDEHGNGSVVYFVDGRFLHCRLPSGRLLAYLDPEVHTKINWRFAATNERGTRVSVSFHSKLGVPMNRVQRRAAQLAEVSRKRLTGDRPSSFTQPHLSFMGRDRLTRQWKRLGAHGGVLTENADQASSRDLLAEAMWRVDQDPRFGLLLSIHDEVIAEAPIGVCSREEFESIMSEVPIWAPKMPVAAEGWVGQRLRK